MTVQLPSVVEWPAAALAGRTVTMTTVPATSFRTAAGSVSDLASMSPHPGDRFDLTFVAEPSGNSYVLLSVQAVR